MIKLTRLVPYVLRILSFLGGCAILYHEVAIADTAEPLLVFVGLWLSGAPIADFLDKLRRLAQLPSPNDPPSPPDAGVEFRKDEPK